MRIKKLKGFTLVEAMVSTVVMAVFIGLVTNLLANYTSTNTAQNIRETMDMDLRKAIERLEKELMSARNILDKGTLFDGDPAINNGSGVDYETSARELIIEVPAYDKNNYPLFEDNGDTKCDTIAIKMVDNNNEKVRRLNPDTNKVESLPVKKLVFSVDPAKNNKGEVISGRTKIFEQSIFQYYIPITEDGEYQSPTEGEILGSDDVIHKLFSFYTQKDDVDPNCLKDSDKASDVTVAELIPGCEKLIKARTIKIVLLAERNYGDKFFTGKRETEIRLRNSTN